LDTDSSAVIALPTAASTHAFGRDQLAPMLEPGDLLIARGRLGVGKTALVQGIGAGLGVEGAVLSPTFVIARIHRGGRLPLVHVDAYRLESLAEIDDLDLDTDLATSVTVVEWGEGMVEHLSDEHVLIELKIQPHDGGFLENRQGEEGAEVDDRPRTAQLTPHGPRWVARLAAASP